MAKRNYRKSSKKIQPAVMKLHFQFLKYDRGETTTIPVGEFATRYLDISQIASLVNRRFYRQGLNWAVSNIQVRTAPLQAAADPLVPKPKVDIVVQKLPNTWVMSNAWEKGMRAWMRQQKEVLEENPSARPKFLDFKIHADPNHRKFGFAGNLLPINQQFDDDLQTGNINTATTGEWAPSKVYTPSFTGLPAAVNGFDIMAVGPNDFTISTVSLIEGYASSRALPAIVDPNLPSDIDDVDDNTPENWITAMFNEGTGQDSEVLVDMQQDNNQAPYPYEGDGEAIDTQYPGGANQLPGLEVHAYSSVTGTTIGGITNIAGGNFPCGLIAITMQNDSYNATSAAVELTLVPGTHRGYLAEPMTDM